MAGILRAVLFLVPALGAGIGAHAADLPDPWSLLGDLRERLEAESSKASFVQIYHPAGFTTGDRETGRLFLGLPECVRWDYEEPYPKIFLLCESTIYTWNPGDQAGRRFLLVESDEPGIDLLRLQLEELRPRYSAVVEEHTDGGFEIILSPTSENPAIAEARITIDAQRQALTSLSYRDLEGNLSRFEITGYEPFDDALFEPPTDLDWLDQ